MNDEQQRIEDEIDEYVEQESDPDKAQRLMREREKAERKADIKELNRLLSAQQVKEDLLQAITDHAPLLSVPPLDIGALDRKGRPKHTWALIMSDAQLGQKTTLQATGEIFEQSTEITTLQMKMLWRKIDELLWIARKAYDVDEFVLYDLGDQVEGDSMRASQAAKTDLPVTRQAVVFTDLQNEFIQNALNRFKKVRVHKVGGNHDRISSRPGLAGLGELDYVDTFSWICGAFQQRMFSKAIDEGRLEFHNYESFFGADLLCGKRVVFEHGASFKASSGSYAGISFYGIMNAARGYMEMLSGADMVLMGHFHKFMHLPLSNGWGDLIVNGAFPPSTEFVQSSFKAFGRPSQTLLEMHDEQGLVGVRRIYIETPNMLKPGQFWERLRTERSAA